MQTNYVDGKFLVRPLKHELDSLDQTLGLLDLLSRLDLCVAEARQAKQALLSIRGVLIPASKEPATTASDEPVEDNPRSP